MADFEVNNKETIINLLNCNGKIQNQLFDNAKKIKEKFFKNEIIRRGVIEISNFCNNSCNYCSMSKQNDKLIRYAIPTDIILKVINEQIKNGFRVFHIVSGETNKIDIDTLKRIVECLTKNGCKTILVTGYRPKEELQQLYDLGARYYIAKFEISNENKYEILNNKSGNLKNRLKLLYDLKDIGYNIGTGNIIGLPYQDDNDLYHDLMLIKEIKPCFASTSVFVPNKNTKYESYEKGSINKTLNYIALMRIILDYPVIIPTNSSLEQDKYTALLKGANLVSINLTPNSYRNKYMLYDMKRNDIKEINKLNNFCQNNQLIISNNI